jgi:hypothetical protein
MSSVPKNPAEPGAPGATISISGKELPRPDPTFGGVIEKKAADSKAWWAPRVVPPKGAPNVLLIMTDDVGFGAPGTFGGVIQAVEDLGQLDNTARGSEEEQREVGRRGLRRVSSAGASFHPPAWREWETGAE